MIDLSFIIVSWNARQYLKDCLTSIQEQTGGYSCEILVVDNDSCDGSPEMVESEFPNVRLVSTGENLGFAKANNVGINLSGGCYICLVNSDVIINSGAISELVYYLDSNPAIGMVGPRVCNADGSLQPSCRRRPGPWRLLCRALAADSLARRCPLLAGETMIDFNHDQERIVDVISGCFMMVRRSAVKDVGLLDEGYFMYAEDVDWCVRFGQKSWSIAFEPAATIIHFGGGSSKRAPVRFMIEQKRALKRLWNRYYGRCGEVYFLAITILHDGLRLVARTVQFIVSSRGRENVGHAIQIHTECLKWALQSLAVGEKQSEVLGRSGKSSLDADSPPCCHKTKLSR